MKKSQNDLYIMRCKLEEKRKNGVKEVLWKLNQQQRDFLTQQGYCIKPWLFCISTKEIWYVSKCESKLLKEIHFARRRGVRAIYKALSEHDKATLREHGIKYVVQKFKIILEK